MTENEYQQRIVQLEREVADLKAKLTAKQKATRYGLVWEDVPEAFEHEAENKIPILEEVKDKAIKNDDGKPPHILIEGDNYHALQCLNYTHRGKVDVIYIDPPYNTGEDNFVYRDKRILTQYPDGALVPKDHPLRHSYWLSFMCKRLQLAKKLLKDDGVIFISINEEEYAQLKILCDSIFIETNYITTFTIKVRHEDRILKADKPIHETTEFLLMYQKSPAFKIQKRTKDNSSPKDYKFKITELTDSPQIIDLGGRLVSVFRKGEYKIEEFEEDFKYLKKINIRGSIKTGNSSGRFHMAYLEDRKNEYNVLYKVPNMGDDGLGYRYFLSRKDAKQANGSYFQGSPLNRKDIKEIPYPNFYDFDFEFNNVGQEGGVPFGGGKKPIAFIQQLLKMFSDKNDYVVLDFFAGSGSTGHSILDLNKKDGIRQFIMVQSPDTTYEIKDNKKVAKPGAADVFLAGFERLVDVTYQRSKNVMQGYTNTKGEKVEGLGNSLKYYRTAFVGNHDAATATDEDKVALAHKAGCLIAIAENTLEEIEANNTYQIFQDGTRYTAVYFSGNLGDMSEFTEKLESLRDSSRLIKIEAYIYCLGNVQQFENEFVSLRRITLHAIPQPIIEIYKQLNA